MARRYKVLIGGEWVGDALRGIEGERYAVEEMTNIDKVCFNPQ